MSDIPVNNIPPNVTTGPHDLIISAGDCTFTGTCSCGALLGQLRPDESFNNLGTDWEAHVLLRHRGCPCDWHQL